MKTELEDEVELSKCNGREEIKKNEGIDFSNRFLVASHDDLAEILSSMPLRMPRVDSA